MHNHGDTQHWNWRHHPGIELNRNLQTFLSTINVCTWTSTDVNLRAGLYCRVSSLTLRHSENVLESSWNHCPWLWKEAKSSIFTSESKIVFQAPGLIYSLMLKYNLSYVAEHVWMQSLWEPWSGRLFFSEGRMSRSWPLRCPCYSTSCVGFHRDTGLPHTDSNGGQITSSDWNNDL